MDQASQQTVNDTLENDGLLDSLPDTVPAPTPKKKRKWIPRVIALVVLLAALTAGGVLAYRTWLAPPQVEADTTPREYTVSMGDIRVSYEADGTVWLPYAYLDASYSAEILELRVQAGDSFQEGDVLAILDDAPLQEAVELKQEALETAQEAVKTAQNGIADAQVSLSGAKRNLAKQQLSYQESIISAEDKKTTNAQNIAAQKQTIEDIKSQLSDAQKQWEAMELLSDEYAKNDIDAQRNTVASLETKLKTEQDNLQIMESNASREDTTVPNAAFSLSDVEDNVQKAQLTLSRAYDTLDDAEKKLLKAQEELDEAQADLADAQLLAPCDGVIAAINFEVGDTVSVPATPSETASLFIYRKAGKPYAATAAVPELDIQNVYEGQTVEILIDAWGEDPFTGVVESVSNLAGTGSNNVITYTARVEFATTESGIRDQMNASLTFITKDVPNVIRINNDALFSENGKSYVTVKLADEQTEKREVKTGFSDGSVTEIKSGLAVGEIILSQTLTNGGSSARSTENTMPGGAAMPGGSVFFVGGDVSMPAGGGGGGGPVIRTREN